MMTAEMAAQCRDIAAAAGTTNPDFYVGLANQLEWLDSTLATAALCIDGTDAQLASAGTSRDEVLQKWHNLYGAVEPPNTVPAWSVTGITPGPQVFTVKQDALNAMSAAISNGAGPGPLTITEIQVPA